MIGKKSFIEGRQLKDGTFWYEGKSYKNFEDLIVFGVLNLNTNGHNAEVLRYIYDGLKHIDQLRDPARPTHPDPEWEPWIKQWNKDALELHGDKASKYIFYYWTDVVELTDHGGCVPGWISYEDFAEGIYNDLCRHFAEVDKCQKH